MKQLRVLPKHLRLRITRSWFKQINYQLNKILHGSEVIFLTIDELWIFQMVFRIQMAFLEIYLSLKFIRLCYLTFCYDFIFLIYFVAQPHVSDLFWIYFYLPCDHLFWHCCTISSFWWACNISIDYHQKGNRKPSLYVDFRVQQFKKKEHVYFGPWFATLTNVIAQ